MTIPRALLTSGAAFALLVTLQHFGPLSIGLLLLGALDARLLADNLPHRISLDARALFVGLREAPLGLGNYLALGGGVRR